MYWYPFNVREAGYLLLVFLFLAYFPLARPADPMRLARFLAVLVGGIYALWIVIKQVLIHQTFSETTVIILTGAFLCPLVAGWCYRLASGRGARR